MKSGPKSTWTDEQYATLESLWPTDTPLKQLAVILGKGISIISETAGKRGLPTRHRGDRSKSARRKVIRVTRRCPDCLAIRKTTITDYAHDCPQKGVIRSIYAVAA